MTPELGEKLYAEFPSIFRERNMPMTETCMCWGLAVGDGWYDLVREVCLCINCAIDNAKTCVIYDYKTKNGVDYGTDLSPEILAELHVGDMHVVATQVKEKFGALCFYWRGENLPERTSGEVSGAVSMAEMMSYHICEQCGDRGEYNERGWLATLCKECREKRRRGSDEEIK